MYYIDHGACIAKVGVTQSILFTILSCDAMLIMVLVLQK
jgi:hypothetical protein